mmetsp:Transcript_31389/g.35123  ORF Transcript_31389/g.35123 Transcript_31389/m.35123 type:complete len:220 (+) Transcript_31389:163-822(+)
MTCDKVPIIAPHVTSNIGLTTWAGSTASVKFSCDWAVLPFLRRINNSVAWTISSRSFLNLAFLRSSTVMPNSPAPSNPPFSPSACEVPSATFSRAASSSFKEKGFSLIPAKIPAKNSCGKSEPFSPIPRLLRTNESRVIRRSSLMEGLCKSVFNMMTEKAKIKAVSAEVKTSGFFRVYRSANFSIIRSIFCASPGKRKPDKNKRIASSKSISVKSNAPT